MSMSRRDLLKIGVVGGAAMALPLERVAYTRGGVDRMATSKMPRYFTQRLVTPAQLLPSGTQEIICPDGEPHSYPRYDIAQQFSVVEVMPGYKTPVFGYNGITPGPTIRAHRGQPIAVVQTNLLHQPPPTPYESVPMPSRYTSNPWQRSTSTHLHGSASLPQYDGYASDLTYPGQRKMYFYPNSQEARTLWYHDHAVHHTSQNAYNGLAAMYILHDDVESGESLQIPTGAVEACRQYDVPLVVRDAMFDTRGRLIYEDNSESGVYGDVILMNGVPWPYLDVEPRKYRFRILNASISRSYTWQLWDGRAPVPMTVIATDAGLMPKPQVVTDLRHAMAERYEVVIDFSKYAGANLVLKNLMPKNNINYDGIRQAMQFRVGRTVTNTVHNAIPSGWEEIVENAECMGWTEDGLHDRNVVNRHFEFERSNGQWTINGETWDDVVDSGYTHCMAEPEPDSIEIWELANPHGGWFHPVHIHLVDFQILSRNGSAANVRPYERGPKDVVYVGEEETVKVAMRFGGPRADDDWPLPQGRYMMHCHNLVHEDHDMMMQFGVGDPDHALEFDPIKAAAAEAI